mmetsp:Transcript_18807/g.43733  ORF Transcript_18807/g.43733 Transcript_18807/m.43733 type:complete len:140 (-) Transcript_18807:973-1392(-)
MTIGFPGTGSTTVQTTTGFSGTGFPGTGSTTVQTNNNMPGTGSTSVQMNLYQTTRGSSTPNTPSHFRYGSGRGRTVGQYRPFRRATPMKSKSGKKTLKTKSPKKTKKSKTKKSNKLPRGTSRGGPRGLPRNYNYFYWNY